MFHNGSMKDSSNYKTLCPLKQREQTTRITYQNGLGIEFYRDTGELYMEEWRGYSIRAALLGVGVVSRICHHWEIYKLLLLLHNVNPVWLEVNITNDNIDFDKVFIISAVSVAI